MTPSPLHKAFTLSILATGTLTTIATSPLPTWTLKGEATTPWQESTTALSIKPKLDDATWRASPPLEIQVKLSPTDPQDAIRITDATWIMQQNASLKEQTLTWVSEQGSWKATTYWLNVCQGQATCEPIFTLTRRAKTPSPTATLHIQAQIKEYENEPPSPNFPIVITPVTATP